MTKILVTGANGQVGSELQDLAKKYTQFDFHFVDLPDLDITNAEAVQQLFAAEAFSYCINCAAFTAVDKAESEKELAYQVNVEGVKNLATSCLLHQNSTHSNLNRLRLSQSTEHPFQRR